MSIRALAITAVCGALAPACAWALPLAMPPGHGLVVTVAATTADPVGAHAAIAQAQER